MSRPRITLLALAAATALALLPGSLAAASGGPIGPNQHFIGLVNGKHAGAVVYTVCPGPLSPGRTGPPAGGQTVEVLRVPKGGGDTGSTGTSVYAYIPGGPPAITQLFDYGTPGAIPTTGRVPCNGPGTVYFSSCALPQPCGAGAKTNDVAVKFEDIAV
ncbi:MAG: hypothetical protein JO368_13300 [Acidimicrobiales bacterium]|nr:hypothetical protein [Acidimicrobiales bacterium]